MWGIKRDTRYINDITPFGNARKTVIHGTEVRTRMTKDITITSITVSAFANEVQFYLKEALTHESTYNDGYQFKLYRQTIEINLSLESKLQASWRLKHDWKTFPKAVQVFESTSPDIALSLGKLLTEGVTRLQLKSKILDFTVVEQYLSQRRSPTEIVVLDDENNEDIDTMSLIRSSERAEGIYLEKKVIKSSKVLYFYKYELLKKIKLICLKFRGNKDRRLFFNTLNFLPKLNTLIIEELRKSNDRGITFVFKLLEKRKVVKSSFLTSIGLGLYLNHPFRVDWKRFRLKNKSEYLYLLREVRRTKVFTNWRCYQTPYFRFKIKEYFFI